LRTLLGLSLTILAASTAAAAPGDPRVVQGTLVWPAALGDERFIVLKTGDGTMYYADVDSARSFAPEPFRVGDRISLAGVEGKRPHEITAVAVAPEGVLGMTRAEAVPGLLAQATTPPVATPAADTPAPVTPTAATPDRPAAPEPAEWQRFDGLVESTSLRSMVMRTRTGKTVTVDISELNKPQWLQVGQEVTIYGHARPDGTVAAIGFILRESVGRALRSAR
jgi:hypothetical protein